ncbi:MAG: DEAD/DEAH box helicase [Nanoarchaeota archaeon]|nr:DEAD/DEAH box helicase [Nanoarchaeota archaeon]
MLLREVQNQIPKKFYEKLQDRIKEFTPPQEKAIKAGLLQGKNILVSAPTASGKTLIAELAMIKQILDNNGKAIYTVPLKALATEKYNEFKTKYEDLGIKIALSIGDLDSADNYLHNYDIIICSNEKLDSLIRHHADWLHNVKVIIIDEVHLLNEPNRGPTLEVIITMLNEILKAQFIALSATIGNPEELADWLGAELVKDTWRPVKLYEGVNLFTNVDFFGKRKGYGINEITKDASLDLALHTIKENKQALVFVNSKRSAESVAENLAREVYKQKLILGMEDEAKKILTSLPTSTKQCEKLSICVKNGVAFHHSGLAPAQRNLIETAFKSGKIKVIACTTTLALGLEFPTDRTIIRDLRRFSGYSQSWIPVLEMKQFTGRAGRPSYHTEGEAVCIARTEKEKEIIYEKYILGEPEEIYSKLALEPVLRMYILSLIAVSFATTREKLMDFFEKTFWAHQYGDIEKIESKIERILTNLEKYGFIIQSREKEKGKIKENLRATNLGIRVSQLYIDPLSAHHLIKCIEQASVEKNNARKLTEIGIMQAISETVEMKPLLNVKQSEYEEIQEELLKNEFNLYSRPDFVDEFYLSSFKTALMFEEWLNERGEDYLFEKYRIRPGELLVKVHNADWLLYSFEQLAILLGKKEILSDIAKFRVRLKYGAKEELLNLIRLKDIGKVRGRILYNAGIRNIRDVKATSIEKLTQVLKSRLLAENIKEQVKIREKG